MSLGAWPFKFLRKMSVSDKPTTKDGKQTKEVKNDGVLKPEDITKNFKSLTDDQIALALVTPSLAPTLLGIFTKLSEDQMKAAFRVMSPDQIKTTVPKLQLQQTGLGVPVMDASQIRVLVASMTSDDRHLLEQNITLIQQSHTKEDLQSFITFIDALAMAPAVNNAEVCKKIIINASLLTPDQLRVVIALTTPSQIKDIVYVLEHENQVEVAISMIDKRDELASLLKKEDIPSLIKKKTDIVSKLKNVKEQIGELDRKIKGLNITNENVADEYEAIVRLIKNTKTDVENLQQSSREIQGSLKLPIKILTSNEHKELLTTCQDLDKENTDLAKQLSATFMALTANDGLIPILNRKWMMEIQPQLPTEKREKSEPKNPAETESGKQEERSQITNSRKEMLSSTDEIFVDEDLSVMLFEAVKQIGNPEAIGVAYPMTWSEIIGCGFRSAKDMNEKGINTLADLQKHIDEQKKAATTK